MKSKYCFCLIGAIVLLTIGCEDFLEIDISDQTVHLNSPFNQLETSNLNIVFNWDTIPKVRKYNLKLVKGSFRDPTGMILDTTFKGSTVVKKLEVGTYEWKVCAINEVSQALSDTFSFVIK